MENFLQHITPQNKLYCFSEKKSFGVRCTLRRINDFSHVRYNCNLGRNSVRYRGPIVWNLIPKAIRDASSQQLFKQKLRQASRILDQIQFEKEACQITSKQTDFLYF